VSLLVVISQWNVTTWLGAGGGIFLFFLCQRIDGISCIKYRAFQYCLAFVSYFHDAQACRYDLRKKSYLGWWRHYVNCSINTGVYYCQPLALCCNWTILILTKYVNKKPYRQRNEGIASRMKISLISPSPFFTASFQHISPLVLDVIVPNFRISLLADLC